MNTKQFITATVVILGLNFAVHAQEEGQQERPHHGRGHGPKLQLTDEQKSCLENLIGKPGEGERPSREKMEAAFNSCGVQKPSRSQASTKE